MNAIEDYLDELGRALQVRGVARHRLLQECRDHLDQAGAEHGPREAVRRFGDAGELAATFDAQVAARRALTSAVASLVAVLAVAGSTLALVNGSSRNDPAVVAWAVVFFAAAQTAAAAAVLAAVQIAAMRRSPAALPDVALLCRRASCALVCAGVAMFAAAAAVPGHASAATLLTGPALAVLAGLTVLRSRSLLRRLGALRQRVTRSPLADLGAAARVATPVLSPLALLSCTAVVAAAAAFIWDRGEHATVTAAVGAAGTEAALTVVGFLLLGPALGLRPGRHGDTSVPRS